MTAKLDNEYLGKKLFRPAGVYWPIGLSFDGKL